MPRKRLGVAAVAVSLVVVGCESGGRGDARGAAGTPAMQSTGKTTHLMRPGRRYRTAWRNSQ